jgi:hypothetical protein
MQQFRLAGLTTFANRILRRLAALPSDAALTELHHLLSTTSRRLEISMSLKGITPAQLTPTMRALRGWIAFLADAEDLRACRDALVIASPLAEAALQSQHRWKLPLRLYLRPMRGVYQLRQRRDGVELSLPTPCISFTPEDFAALMPYVFAGDVHGKRHVLHQMQSEAFQSISAQLEVLCGAVDSARGTAYDLAEIFDRANARYFHGQVKRPKLFWSRSLTRRKFGHYDWVGDAVMISRTLDDVKVPAYVVEFVMFHELLHKVLGLRWSGQRQYAHTAEFYRLEKQYPRHADAEAALQKLARQRRA